MTGCAGCCLACGGGREWWDPPAAARRVRGEGSAEMRPGARKAAGGDGYAPRKNWGGRGALWGARGGGGGLFSCFDCRLTRIRSRLNKRGRVLKALVVGDHVKIYIRVFPTHE